MALSFVEYTADGVDTQFIVTFPFIARAHVSVTIDGVDDATFTWINDGLIEPTDTPANLEKVRITRATPTGALVLTDFADGSTLIEADLDRGKAQAMFVAEESNDAATNSLGIADDDATKWDAETKIIKNVVDPTADQHAATKKYGDDNWGGQSATDAAASAVLAAADAVLTAADVVLTNADVVTAAASAAAAANSAQNVFTFALTDEETVLTTGQKLTWRAPFAMTLKAADAGLRASLKTAATSGTVTLDVKEAGSTILSTLLTFDANEKTTKTASAAVVISDVNIAEDAEITFHITVAGSGSPVGLKIAMTVDPA